MHIGRHDRRAFVLILDIGGKHCVVPLCESSVWPLMLRTLAAISKLRLKYDRESKVAMNEVNQNLIIFLERGGRPQPPSMC